MHISNKCSIAVHCLLFIHEYGSKTKVTSKLLGLSSGCNPVTIRNILSALKKDGILSVKSGTGGANIICPLEEISLYRLCMAVEPDALDKLMGLHHSPSPQCPVGRNIHNVLAAPYEKIRKDLENSLRSITMKDIAKEYQDKLQGADLGIS